MPRDETPIHRRRLRLGAFAVSIVSLALLAGSAARQGAPQWTDSFPLDAGELASTGRNPYFSLEPGYQLVLENAAERLTITVLAETRVVQGIETRVVEERQTHGATLVEVSRNYFAISRRSNGVYYFGEDVDAYEGGRRTHDGSWLAGVNGARFGLMMPGAPLVGSRYYQELAPGVAMDRAHIVSVNGSLAVPAGRFQGVVRIEETTPLEPGAREYKSYAAGIGLLQDGALRLVRHGFVKATP
jgi:hypothetical protein